MIANTLAIVKKQMAEIAQRYGRKSDSVQLLAVSKTRSVAEIITAVRGGQYRFGENYLQEALSKIQALKDYTLEWHFIGALQTNKTRPVAEHFAWVHSLDNLKHAHRLNTQRPHNLPPLNVCVQVNVSAEPQKAGINLSELPEFAQAITQLSRLRLRGLMTLPAPSHDFAEQRKPFYLLYTAFNQLKNNGLELDTLSMGMTDDMEAAIAEGATMIRIGTAIFGERTKGMPKTNAN